MEKFNTDTNSFEKIWYNGNISIIEDKSDGYDWGELQKMVGEMIERGEGKGYKSIKVQFGICGDMGEETAVLEINGWREETDEEWNRRLTWRRDVLLRNIEEHEKRDLERSRALVEKINGLIKK